jgi:putative tryptophan/tyrosine transport system substrate-binding protein
MSSSFLGVASWIEGRTVTVDYRWGEGSSERAAQLAKEFVRRTVDIIVTSGTPQIIAAKQATSIVPIVFATAGDPVSTGVVASLAHPRGNVTGLATLAADLAGKRLELLREVVPGLHRLAIMGDVDNPFTVLSLARFSWQPEHSISKPTESKSGERKILCPPSRR